MVKEYWTIRNPNKSALIFFITYVILLFINIVFTAIFNTKNEYLSSILVLSLFVYISNLEFEKVKE